MRKKTLAFIMKYVLKKGFLFVLSVILAIFAVVSTLLFPIITGKAVDTVVSAGNVDFETLKNILIIGLIVVGVTVLSQFLLSLVNNRMTAGVVYDIRKDVMNKIQKLPVSYIDGRKAGDLVTVMTADVETLSDGLLMGFTQVFTGVMTIILTLGIMIALNWKIAIVVICVTPLSFFVAGFISKRTYNLFTKQNKARAEQVSFVNEMVGNQKAVRAFGMEEENLEKFDSLNDTFKSAALKATFYSSLTNPSTRFVNSVVYAGVAVFGAISIVHKGSLTIGTLTSFLFYANQYTKPFNEISGVITEFQNALSSAERIKAFLDERELFDKEDAVGSISDDFGMISFKNISFSYKPEQKLIENFSVDVKKGTRVAIVGPTGCGKTTLINLLMRFYSVKDGEIRIDGVPVNDIVRRAYREKFGMVLQDTWLKNASVRENITFGRDFTDEEIEEACRKCHAHSFIERLPQGYDTIISEDGGNLSNGQKQLLCIARVMLLNPPILILDEATSSIDTRTELKVQDAFDKLMKGKTSFIVAHRLSTIRNADIILVMNDGNIVEQGTHEELLSKRGFYYNLYMSQWS